VVEEIHAGNLKSEIMPRNLNEIVRSWIRLQFKLFHKNKNSAESSEGRKEVFFL
jgi:hypothetical protein